LPARSARLLSNTLELALLGDFPIWVYHLLCMATNTYMRDQARNETQADEPQVETRRGVGWPAVLVLLAGALALTIWAYRAGWFNLLSDLTSLRQWALSLGRWAPLAIIALNALQTVVAPLPGQALNWVSGFLFGPWLGTLYTLAGMLTGSLIVLAVVRRFGRPLAERLAGAQRLARFDRLAEQRGALFLFLVFLFPFLPDDLACLAAGLTPLPIWQILLLSLAGRLPGLFVANLIGARASDLAPWQWALFGVVIVALALLFWRFQPAIEERFMRLAERLSRRR
jgi:uncharacterized membrane protein YdjX (TVP38/TMEM64 family)